jgi:DNA-binding MarR family transcriptional regulator
MGSPSARHELVCAIVQRHPDTVVALAETVGVGLPEHDQVVGARALSAALADFRAGMPDGAAELLDEMSRSDQTLADLYFRTIVEEVPEMQQHSPSQLMTLLGTDTAGMTKLADRFEAKHLIERHPNPRDRRSVLITPTPGGQALVPQLAPVFGRVTRQLFNGFNPGEVSALTAMLERMRGNLATTATMPRLNRPETPAGNPSQTARAPSRYSRATASAHFNGAAPIWNSLP